MSLINDALKRARDSQQTAPRETPELEFRPVDAPSPPGTSSRGSLGVLLPVALAVVGLLMAFLVWQRIKDHRNQVPREITVRAVNPGPVPAAVEPAPAKAPNAAEPLAVSTGLKPAQAAPDPALIVQTTGTANSPAPATAGVVGEPAATNAAAPALAPAPPKPAPPKLQGVVWNPRRPSALINGQVLFIGDRMGDYRVTRITRSSATLAKAGQTVVLTLH